MLLVFAIIVSRAYLGIIQIYHKSKLDYLRQSLLIVLMIQNFPKSNMVTCR